DRRAAAAHQPGPAGERREGIRGGRDRHQVGADVAQREDLAVGLVAPDLAAEPGQFEPGIVYPGADEHVDDGVTVAQREYLAEIAIVEQAQCRGSPCLGAQHSSSVSAGRRRVAPDTPSGPRGGTGPSRSATGPAVPGRWR